MSKRSLALLAVCAIICLLLGSLLFLIIKQDLPKTQGQVLKGLDRIGAINLTCPKQIMEAKPLPATREFKLDELVTGLQIGDTNVAVYFLETAPPITPSLGFSCLAVLADKLTMAQINVILGNYLPPNSGQWVGVTKYIEQENRFNVYIHTGAVDNSAREENIGLGIVFEEVLVHEIIGHAGLYNKTEPMAYGVGDAYKCILLDAKYEELQECLDFVAIAKQEPTGIASLIPYEGWQTLEKIAVQGPMFRLR